VRDDGRFNAFFGFFSGEGEKKGRSGRERKTEENENETRRDETVAVKLREQDRVLPPA